MNIKELDKLIRELNKQGNCGELLVFYLKKRNEINSKINNVVKTKGVMVL